MYERLMEIFPKHIRNSIVKLTEEKIINEIRLRINKPVIIKMQNKEVIMNYIAVKKDIEEVLDYVSHYSLYAYNSELCNGYITITGGHRIGIAGSVIMENNRITNIKNISSLNIRVANEIKDCGMQYIKYLVDDCGKIRNTLIISPPGCGKTTLLRDIIRLTSDKSNVTVIDERSEITGNYMGQSVHDLGKKCDIIDNCPKAAGILMAIRTMSPDVIAIDEIGGKEDFLSIAKASYSGCRILATIHAEDYQDVLKKHDLKDIKVFERFVIIRKSLIPGIVNHIADEKNNVLWYLK